MKIAHIGLAAALLTTAAASAHGHDSWFERRPAPHGDAAAATVLALGTGNQFPKQETGIAAEYLAAAGCDVGVAEQPLQPLHNDAASLLLRAPAGATSCWVQLQPFELTVAPDKVPLYLKEIQASPALRATWAAMQARGLPWRERYVKHARIELGSAAPGAAPGPSASPLGMDLRLEPGPGGLVVGASLTALVLRDGQPLAGQALELRSENSALGIWRRSDDQGRVTLPLPLAGRWLLRGVDLRLAADSPDQWDSRFVTLAFEVLPRPAAADQNGSSFRLNARSANQAAAMAAINSEPPSSTARR